MKLIALIGLVVFCQEIFCQKDTTFQLTFETGDYIIWSHGPDEDPKTYSVDREKDMEGLEELTDYFSGFPDMYLVTMIDPSRKDLYSIRTDGGRQYVQAINDVYGGLNFAYNQEQELQPIYQDGKLVFPCGSYLKIPTSWFPRAKNILIESPRRVIVLFTRNPYKKSA
jgi:hypothetical protein